MDESNIQENHQRRKHFNACKQPPQSSSFSEIKSATLNSSFFQNGLSSPIFNMQVNFGMENQSPLINSETNRIHKFLVPDVDIKQVTEKGRIQGKIIQTLIIKFIKNLMQQTYYYKEGIFSQFQKVFLTEKYLEDVTPSSNSGFSLIQYFVWEITICTILVLLMGWLPLQLCFPMQQKHTINGIIIMLLCIDFLKSYLKSILKDQEKKQECQFVDIIYIISFIMIQYGEERYLQQIALLASVIASLKKLKQKYQIWCIYLEYDLHYFFVICKLLLLIHYCACIFRMIGPSNNWIEEFDHKDPFIIYCYSLYWSTASLLNIGQSIIKIETEIELIYSTIIMLLSCYVFSYILYHTTNFIKDQERQDHRIRQQLSEINKYFKGKPIPLKLKGQIRDFLQNEQTKSEDLDQIIFKLPQNIKEQLFLSTRLDVVEKCSLFQKFSKKVSECLTQHMEEIHCQKNQIVEQIDFSLYIIQKGKIQIMEANKFVGFLHEGESFGEYQFFTGNQKKTQYRTSEPTSLYKISQQKFMKIIQQENFDYERYMFIRHSLLFGNYSVINSKCRFCESKNHLISDCPSINYKPNIEKIIKKQTFGTQTRQKNKRNDTFRKRVNNQVLARLKQTRESLKLFREQNNLVSDDDSADDGQSLDEHSHLDQQSEQLYSSNSNNRIIEASKEGTAVSILKNQDPIVDKQLILDVQENQEEIANKKYNQRHSEQDEQPQLQYRVSLWPIDQFTKKSYTQLEQISLSELPSDGPTPKMDERLRKKSSRFSIKNQIHNKGQVSRTKPEDHETLNLSNRLSEEQLTNPFTKHGGQHSNPQTNCSMKRIFSSKLSIIPTKNQLAIFEKQIQNPLAAFNLQFNSSPQFMDLEVWKHNPVDQEFENMREYKIYYPFQNYSSMVKNANYYQRQQLINQSNYSFKTRIRQITQQLQIKMKL